MTRGITLPLLLVALVALTQASVRYQMKVEPKAEDCFYKDFPVDTTVTFEWNVLDGGLLDIDVRVFQQRTRIHSVLYFEGRDRNSYQFKVATTGPHAFCFNNEMSRFTVKTVVFTITDDGAMDSAKPEDLTPFEQSVNRIKGSLHTLEQEQTYHRVREHIHRNTAESTNTRVYVWSMLESGVLLLLSVAQIIYLRRLFAEDKRLGGAGV